jgi:hypothetical protein
MWNVYCEFCQQYGEIPVPATGETLCRYSVYLVIMRHCAVPTVKNHLSCVKRYHLLFHDIKIPSPSEYLPLDATLKGAAKFLGRSVQQKYPVTPNILAALTISIPQDSPYRTAYNLFFFGLPRVGNVLPYSTSKFSKTKHLTWDKIMRCSDGVIVTLKVTKTIQHFERELRIPISSSPDRPEFCVRTGLEMIKKLPGYPKRPQDPVFNVYRDKRWLPMCKNDFAIFLKDHLKDLGIHSKMITPCSFRKGGLSHMLLKVGNMELLRLQGDWLSESYKRYLIIPAELRFSVTKEAICGMPN